MAVLRFEINPQVTMTTHVTGLQDMGPPRSQNERSLKLMRSDGNGLLCFTCDEDLNIVGTMDGRLQEGQKIIAALASHGPDTPKPIWTRLQLLQMLAGARDYTLVVVSRRQHSPGLMIIAMVLQHHCRSRLRVPQSQLLRLVCAYMTTPSNLLGTAFEFESCTIFLTKLHTLGCMSACLLG
jgi:hypothetical protein